MNINLVDPAASEMHVGRIFKRSLKHEETKKWVNKHVNKWLRKRFENIALLPPGHTMNLPEWASNAESEGKPLHRFVLGYSSESILKHINDMFADLLKAASDDKNPEVQNYSQKIINTLSHYNVEQMYDLANEYYANLAELNGPHSSSRKRSEVFAVARNDGQEVAYSVGGQGNVWRQVVPRGLKTVAVKLKNCLGGRNYAHGLRSGEKEIWVLVKPDENGNTENIDNIEAVLQMSVRTMTVDEVKGAGNRIPFEYDKEIEDLSKLRGFKNPEIKRRYSGFRGQPLEDRAKRIVQSGDWEFWIDNEPLANRRMLSSYRIFSKNINGDEYHKVGVFCEISPGFNPVMEGKKQVLNIDETKSNGIYKRDYITALNQTLEVLLDKGQEHNVTFFESSIYSPLEYLQDNEARNPEEFINNKSLKEKVVSYSTNVAQTLFKNNKIVPWHDEIIYETFYDDLHITLQSNGSMTLSFQSIDNEVNIQNRTIIVPATEETLKLSNYITKSYSEFPLNFAQFKKAKALKDYKNLSVSEKEKEEIKRQWILANMKYSVTEDTIADFSRKYLSFKTSEEKDDILKIMLDIDSSGHVLNGKIKSQESDYIYSSILVGALPKDKILTKGGYQDIPSNWNELSEKNAYQDLKYFTYFSTENELNARLYKTDDGISIGVFETPSLSRRESYTNDNFNYRMKLIIDSFSDNGNKNSSYLQDMHIIQNICNSYREGTLLNPDNSIVPGTVSTDIFPHLFLNDPDFGLKKKRNIGTTEYPIIRLNKPQRYVGIIPDSSDDYMKGRVGWIANKGDNGLKIHHLFEGGVEHLSQSLINKGWQLDAFNVSYFTTVNKQIEEAGYYIYNGNLLESSNKEIDNLTYKDYISCSRLHQPACLYKREPGDDRAWSIKVKDNIFYSGSRSMTSTKVFNVISTSIREDSRNYAYIEYQPHISLNKNEDAILDCKILLAEVLDKSNLKISDFDSVWLNIFERDGNYVYSTDGYNEDGSITIDENFRAYPANNKTASFEIKDNEGVIIYYVDSNNFRKKEGFEERVILTKKDLDVLSAFYNSIENIIENQNTLEDEKNAERILSA